MAKKTKSRSNQGRVAPTKKGMDKMVQGRIKKGEIITPGKALGKLAAVAARGGLGVKAAVKAAKAAKRVRAGRSGRAAVAASQKAGPSRSKKVLDTPKNEKISLRRSLDIAEEGLKKANKQADDKLAKFWNMRIKSTNNKLNELKYM